MWTVYQAPYFFQNLAGQHAPSSVLVLYLKKKNPKQNTILAFYLKINKPKH